MAKLISDSTEIEVPDGKTIVPACKTLGVRFSCYSGACATCRIEILEGADNLNELEEAEVLNDCDRTHRLACQCRIKSGTIRIRV